MFSKYPKYVIILPIASFQTNLYFIPSAQLFHPIPSLNSLSYYPGSELSLRNSSSSQRPTRDITIPPPHPKLLPEGIPANDVPFSEQTSPEATVFARSIRPNNEIVRRLDSGRNCTPRTPFFFLGSRNRLRRILCPGEQGVGDLDRNYDNWDRCGWRHPSNDADERIVRWWVGDMFEVCLDV